MEIIDVRAGSSPAPPTNINQLPAQGCRGGERPFCQYSFRKGGVAFVGTPLTIGQKSHESAGNNKTVRLYHRDKNKRLGRKYES